MAVGSLNLLPERTWVVTVHGYGGGVYAVDGLLVWRVDGVRGDVLLVEGHDKLRVVLERTSEDEHFVDLIASSGQLWLERGTDDGDEVVELGPDGHRAAVLSTGGFLGSPRPFRGRRAW